VGPKGRLDLDARTRSGTGQGVVEYGLILALAVIVCIVSLLFFSDQLSTILSMIASAI
jgi:Flp pilus assembly pilin Flp